MKLYIIIGNNTSYGVFESKEEAEQEKQNIYNNGYFGELNIIEDELKG